MKIFFAIVLCCAATGAAAQSGQDGLRETRYAGQAAGGGDLTVRWGQPAPRPAIPKPSFAALDSNGDGQIDSGEASAYETLANDFEYADHNRDLRVSKREYDRW
jgi:hypothetical protein